MVIAAASRAVPEQEREWQAPDVEGPGGLERTSPTITTYPRVGGKMNGGGRCWLEYDHLDGKEGRWLHASERIVSHFGKGNAGAVNDLCVARLRA